MASKRIKGITIELDGDATGLNDALKDVDRSLSETQSALKDVDRLLKLDPTNTELLAQKQKLLQRSIGDTEDRLKTLKTASEQAAASAKKYDDWKAAFDPIQSEIDDTKKKLKELKDAQQELKNAGKIDTEAYKNLQEEIQETNKKLLELKKAAKEVNDEFGTPVSPDQYDALQREIAATEQKFSGLTKEMEQVRKTSADLGKSLQDAGEKAEDSSGGFTIMKGAIADLTANAIQGAIGKVGDFVQSLFELSEATEEYRSMQAKLSGSANAMGYAIEYAQEQYANFYRYVGDDQMATNAITNLMGMRVSTQTVSDVANAAIAVWSAYGDSIPIEGLTESINETAQVAQVTGSLADALNWAGISEDDFNAKLESLKTTQERADAIAQILNDRYGQSKQRYDEMAVSILDANTAELALKDTQADLGSAMEPVNTALMEMKSNGLEKIKPLVEEVAGACSDLLKYLNEHPAAMRAVTAAAVALAAALGILATALAIQALIKGVQKAMKLLNTTMLANPIVLIAAAIAGLAAGFIYLWNTSEGFRNFWVNLWNTIKGIVSTVVDGIVGFFTVTIPDAWNNFIAFLGEFIGSIIAWFQSLPEKIGAIIDAVVQFFVELPGKIWNAILSAVDFIAQWGQNVWNAFTDWVSRTVDAVVQFFADLPYKIGYAIGFVIGKITDWAKNVWEVITIKVPEIIRAIVNFFAELPGKIWNWLVETWNRLVEWGGNMITTAGQKISEMIISVVSFLSELPGKVWNWLVGTWNRLVEWGGNMITTAGQKISEMITSIIKFISELPGKVWDWLKKTWNKLVSWGSDMLKTAKEAAGNVVSGIVDAITALPGKMLEIGKNIISGIWDGITSGIDWIKGKISDFCGGIVDGFKSALGIHSPSTIFADESEWIPEGVAKGVKKNARVAANAVSTLADGMITKFDGSKTRLLDMVRNLSGYLSGDFMGQIQLMAAASGPNVNLSNNVTVMVGGKKFDAYVVKTAQNGIGSAQSASRRAKGGY